MQDAVQYGAVEASSPPTPPKRFGRKTVVALAALGLAGVVALSLGPQKMSGTGLVASPSRRPLCLRPGSAWIFVNLHAIEPMRSRRQRRVDGVGRPKFDFHIGCQCAQA